MGRLSEVRLVWKGRESTCASKIIGDGCSYSVSRACTSLRGSIVRPSILLVTDNPSATRLRWRLIQYPSYRSTTHITHTSIRQWALSYGRGALIVNADIISSPYGRGDADERRTRTGKIRMLFVRHRLKCYGPFTCFLDHNNLHRRAGGCFQELPPSWRCHTSSVWLCNLLTSTFIVSTSVVGFCSCIVHFRSALRSCRGSGRMDGE